MMKIIKSIIQKTLLSFFFSCSNKESPITNKSSKDSISVSDSINHKPLFLGLNPYMKNEEYDSQIKKLNKEGVLEENYFTVKYNNESFIFNVSKTPNSIRLEFNDFITVIKSPDYNKDLEEDLNPKYELEKNQIIKMYNNKYEKANWQLSKNIDFSKFGFNLDNYILYKVKDKYILLGYSMPETYTNNTVEKNKNSKEDKLFGSDVMLSKNNDFVSYEYGLKVQIDYLEINDINKILKRMNNEVNSEIENIKRRNKIESNLEKNRKNNINNI